MDFLCFEDVTAFIISIFLIRIVCTWIYKYFDTPIALFLTILLVIEFILLIYNFFKKTKEKEEDCESFIWFY